jgi:hypothetical protein
VLAADRARKREDLLAATEVITRYKTGKHFAVLDLRPVFHHLEERVRAHVLICMLACYLTWHLRRAWAPLTFTDQEPPAPGNPVTAARRSAAAQTKASYQHDRPGSPTAASAACWSTWPS